MKRTIHDVGSDTDPVLLPKRSSRDEQIRAVNTVLRNVGDDREVLRMLLGAGEVVNGEGRSRVSDYDAGWCDAIRYAARLLRERDDDWVMWNHEAVEECARYVGLISSTPPAPDAGSQS